MVAGRGFSLDGVNPSNGFHPLLEFVMVAAYALFGALRLPAEPMPATLDYIVAAVGGCLTGTVAGALEARGVRADPEKLQVEAEGKIEEVDGKMILTGIKVRYHLKVPKDKRATVERALEHHEGLCAASESVRRGITVEWQSEIEEESENESGQTAAATSAASHGKD